MIAGHNVAEGIAFIDLYAQSEARFEADLRFYYPSIPSASIHHISQTLYPPIFNGSFGYTTQSDRLALFLTEALFSCNSHFLARAYGNRTFNYLFSVPPARHGDDVPYTYYNGPIASVKNDSLAVIWQQYFTNFATTGNPNGPGLPRWLVYGSNSTVQNLNLTTVGPFRDDAANPRCEWWQKGLYY